MHSATARHRHSLPRFPYSVLALAIAGACASGAAVAQEAVEELDRVEVLGSNIRKVDVEGQSPVLTISRAEIERTGLTSIGEILQDLTSGGKALSSQFNSSGNYGPPPDGGGIGAGSAQVDLRHLESKRVLVLVDGKRWINESSASGIGGAVDLNTIPLAIVQAIEVLGDGASAVYGSDAIAGVVNIVTRKDFRGAEVFASYGEFEQGDSETSRAEITLGGGGYRFHGVLSLGYNDQQRVSSADRDYSSADPAGITRGSPVTPQGRFLFVPALGPNTPLGLCPPTVDVTGDGVPDVPLCDITSPPNAAVGENGTPSFPDGYVRYTDDQSFNGQSDNLLLAPNRRKHAYASGRFEINDHVGAYAKALYNTRESLNQAAAQTIVIGPEAPGNGKADTIGVSPLNPYNPFGIPLVPGANMFAIARRPLEGGPRIFRQVVDTTYFSAGLEGSFGGDERSYFWDVNYIDSRSEAEQRFSNAYNLGRIALALGDPAVCAQTAGCVPLNLFGGMGPDGQGTITPEMLNWIRTEVNDQSTQDLQVLSANLSGDLFQLPGGMMSFAAGVERREYEGSLTPDTQRVSGDIADQATNTPVSGKFHVSEAYLETNIPLGARFDVSVAGRYSDYSTFGSVNTGKLGFKWRPSNTLLIRGNYAEGFRAPFIGELFGLSQFGAVIDDPCSGYASSGNAQLIANCQALGVPATYKQLSSQVFTTTGGNSQLQPESSESYTFGVVYSPGWAQQSGFADKLDFEATYYNHIIKDAIQAPDAQDILDRCVASGDLQSSFCTGIGRLPSGTISAFDNRLDNIGRIETDGVDVRITWERDTRVGEFAADWRSTYVNDYTATDAFGNEFSRAAGVEVNDSSIPRWQSNLSLGWTKGPLYLGWTMRFIHAVVEKCSDAFDNNPQLSLTALGLCSDPNPEHPELSRNRLGGVTYNDFHAGWTRKFGDDYLRFSFGINNVFDKEPPESCFSCALNGYDPGTYDVSGRFYYLQATYHFE